ncbi:Hsp20 family protein [Phenylobacterium montanum]|uniref:Hsp20 family protein n=1 Tax=Phenylobacterium montanum TaxID=2823693 RepID=A0A975G3S6_9CAUL|nr:Hsp20 family protein [Caulobacter sp. S6]QUD90605.1 Hsp20 family protein [Caulobacter sp. S6]
MRTAYDFSPLYRSVIGVDRMADLIETAMRTGGESHYPPYDIEKTGEGTYRITLAAAGFGADELELTAQPNLLVVTGRKAKGDEGRNYLHRGIAGRDFERRFELADYVVVKSADYANGVLSIDLAREVPEALKPRRIEIAQAGGAKVQQLRQDASERQAA